MHHPHVLRVGRVALVERDEEQHVAAGEREEPGERREGAFQVLETVGGKQDVRPAVQGGQVGGEELDAGMAVTGGGDRPGAPVAAGDGGARETLVEDGGAVARGAAAVEEREPGAGDVLVEGGGEVVDEEVHEDPRLLVASDRKSVV